LGERAGGEGNAKPCGAIARKLRNQSTDAERCLWRHLRDRQVEGFKFRRQHPIGRYVVDFVNLQQKLVVEADGGQHSHDPNDKIRGAWLQDEGYKVLRFWNNEVSVNLEGVLESIGDALGPRPNPLPERERENEE
jgi:very-short-patch-repair endonuclease